MNTTRTGKIARLPSEIRQELNRRLDQGEKARSLVAWLNALPEVQAVVKAGFGGKPVCERNITKWRQGGYRDWVERQDSLEVAGRLGAEAGEWKAEGNPPIADTLALWAAARIAVATRRVPEADGPERWWLLREMCADIVQLRKGDHNAERLRIKRERMELGRKMSEKRLLEKLGEMLHNPEAKKRLCGVLGMEGRLDVSDGVTKVPFPTHHQP